MGISKHKNRCLYVSLRRGRKVINEWGFFQSGRYAIKNDYTAPVFLPEAGMQSGELYVRLKKNRAFLEFSAPVKGVLAFGDKQVSIGMLYHMGLIPMQRGRAQLPIEENTRIVLDLAGAELSVWSEYKSTYLAFSGVPLMKKLWPQWRFREVLALLFSLLIHVSVISFMVNRPAREVSTVAEALPRRYLSAQYSKEITEQLVEQKKITESQPRRSKSKTLSQADASSYKGFLKAVTRRQDRDMPKNDDGFSALFGTGNLSGSLEKALSGKGLSRLLKENEGTLNTGTGKLGSLRPGQSAEGLEADMAYESQRERAGGLKAELSSVAAQNISAPSSGQGSLDKNAVAGVINARAGQLKACYERATMSNRNLSGRVELLIRLDANGKPERVNIRSNDINDINFQRCLIARVSSWQFPKPEGGSADIEFPIIFTSS